MHYRRSNECGSMYQQGIGGNQFVCGECDVSPKRQGPHQPVRRNDGSHHQTGWEHVTHYQAQKPNRYGRRQIVQSNHNHYVRQGQMAEQGNVGRLVIGKVIRCRAAIAAQARAADFADRACDRACIEEEGAGMLAREGMAPGRRRHQIGLASLRHDKSNGAKRLYHECV